MLGLPAITYLLGFLPGAPRQAVHGADRPVCALLAAAAAHDRGDKLMGAVRNMTAEQLVRVLDAGFTAAGLDRERARRFVDSIDCYRLRVDDIPDPINGLAPSLYQVDAVRGMTIAGGVLNLGVGLGKTLTTAFAATVYRTENFAAPARCWIVAPLIAHGAWKPYLAHLRSLYDDVQILSIDSAHKYVGAAPVGGLLIVDEAHLAGGLAARRARALHTLRLGFDVCLCLTGTLLHGGVERALAVLDLAIPGAAGFSSRWKAGEYFNVLVKTQFGVRLEKPTGPRKEKFLEFISRYVVALTKESPSVRAEVQIPGQDLHLIEIGDANLPLEHVISNTAMAIFDETGELPTAQAVAHLVLRQGAEAKLDWLMDQMDDPTQGVVVFANYHESLDKIEARLTAESVPYVRVDGNVVGADREEAVRKFQASEVQVFLGQMTAAGAAINLYRAHVSVSFDWCMRGADYAQMLGRTCRRGQDLHCHHFDLASNRLQIQCVMRLRDADNFHLDLSLFQQHLTPESPGKE